MPKRNLTWIVIMVTTLILLVVYLDVKADTPPDNCTEFFAEGRSNIPSDDPDYNPRLDRDHNGIACQR